MSLKDEIRSAIASHSMWKAHLDRAITTGVFETPVDTIAVDNECYFGKWLYGNTIPLAVRDSAEYKKVRDHHAEFHRVAAKVAGFAVAGNKVEASKLMASNGEYTMITTQLVLALEAWANTAA